MGQGVGQGVSSERERLTLSEDQNKTKLPAGESQKVVAKAEESSEFLVVVCI